MSKSFHIHPSHAQLKRLISLERQTLAQILSHLKIINDKKIFTQLGYHSLLDYLVKEFKYSEAAAYRRISALRLARKIPQVQEKIAAGEINLSSATKLNSLLDLKEKSSGEKVSMNLKMDLLGCVAGISTKRSEDLVREKLNLPIRPRKISIEVSDDTYAKWIEFKGRHVAKRMSDEQLFLFAMNEANKEKTVRAYRRAKPQREITAPVHRKAKPQQEIATAEYCKAKPQRKSDSPKQENEQQNEEQGKEQSKQQGELQKQSKNPRYISAQIKRDVKKRVGNRCQARDCASVYGLEIDHIRAFSRGGGGELANLQLLCRHHNQLKSNF